MLLLEHLHNPCIQLCGRTGRVCERKFDLGVLAQA
jgi:hypothetical protein